MTMTNCNCECFCQEMENWQDDCLCCVCDFDFERDNFQNVPYVPSRQEIERELESARASVEFYENQINMLDRQDSDYEWKLDYNHGMLSRFRQNVFQLENL